MESAYLSVRESFWFLSRRLLLHRWRLWIVLLRLLHGLLHILSSDAIECCWTTLMANRVLIRGSSEFSIPTALPGTSHAAKDDSDKCASYPCRVFECFTKARRCTTTITTTSLRVVDLAAAWGTLRVLSTHTVIAQTSSDVSVKM